MADTKLSALTATTTLVDSDEFYVNDGGVSKKITKGNLDDNINIALSQIYDVTATAAEVNVLDGIPAGLTATELGYVDGVTSAIQTQIDSKQATITGGATSITSSNLTASRALASDGSGKVAVSSVTSTELGYLSGVTSAVQTQLDAKAAASPNFSASYTSSAQTITPGGALTLAHSLGAQPSLVQCYLTCTSSANGYTTGDEVLIQNGHENDGTNPTGMSVVPDATNVNIRYGDGTSTIVFYVINKTDGTRVGITNGNWKLVVRAWV